MEKALPTHGSNSTHIDGGSLGKDEQEHATIIGEAFSSWKTWRSIDDDGSLEQRNSDVHSHHRNDNNKPLEKDGEDSHRIDAISESNYGSDTLTSYIRPEFTSKSWEVENAQPLVSSGLSRTHTLPRTRSLPEIRIPDDYETVVDDKLETNSLQDNVITFLSADQLHGTPLKSIDDKDLHHSGDTRNHVGRFIRGYAEEAGGENEAVIKNVARTTIPTNGTEYSFAVQSNDLGQHLSQESGNMSGTAQNGKRKVNNNAKKSSRKRRKCPKNNRAANLLSNMPQTSDFVGETTMMLEQPISQMGGLYTVQISPANPEMQAVIQQQPVSTVQQPLQFEHVPADEVRTEKIQVGKVEDANQQWFTSKDDKNSFQDKGVKWRMGMWSKDEVKLLKENIDKYCKMQNIENPCQLIFGTPKDERKQFYKSIAKGISRPLFAIYRKTLRLYDRKNYIGKYSEEEVEKLRNLHTKHGNDWTTIGNLIGRSAASVKDRCRL